MDKKFPEVNNSEEVFLLEADLRAPARVLVVLINLLFCHFEWGRQEEVGMIAVEKAKQGDIHSHPWEDKREEENFPAGTRFSDFLQKWAPVLEVVQNSGVLMVERETVELQKKEAEKVVESMEMVLAGEVQN